MRHSYTKEVVISRGPKTITAMMIGGRYKDPRQLEMIIKSIASTLLLTGAAIVSAFLTMM